MVDVTTNYHQKVIMNSFNAFSTLAEMSDIQIVQSFLSGNLKRETTLHNKKERELIAQKILSALLNTPLSSFRGILQSIPCSDNLTTADIPQFSNMETAMYYIPKLLVERNDSFSYRELGMLIHPCKSICAAAKYGENQAKLTISLALAQSTTKSGFAAISKSDLTEQFCQLSQNNKSDVLQKLCYRIPIVQAVVNCDDWMSSLDKKLSFLSDSMIKRRKHCCVDLICFALGE